VRRWKRSEHLHCILWAKCRQFHCTVYNKRLIGTRILLPFRYCSVNGRPILHFEKASTCKTYFQHNKPAVVDSNFAPAAVTWRTGRNITPCSILVYWPHYTKTRRHPQNRKCILYNVLRCQRRTEPRSQVTGTENFVKLGMWLFEISERTDRQTKRHTNKQT